MSPDIEQRLSWLQDIILQGPTPLFATSSGAHLDGFESPDSDYDLRGAFVPPLAQVLSLRGAEETNPILEVRRTGKGCVIRCLYHHPNGFAANQ